MKQVEVSATNAEYSVTVGKNLLDKLSDLIPPSEYASKAVIVTSQNIQNLYGSAVDEQLRAMELEVHTIIVPEGEAAKSIEVASACWTQFGEIYLSRWDYLIALGGGVVGDLAGFAAASWHRGVPVVQIATSIVAQVDSAVGGKTAINTPLGKNLVGAFHPPIAVICDIETLATLPDREFRAGLAEIVKCGFIADPEILNLIEGHTLQQVRGNDSLTAELIERAVTVKATIVTEDERDTGRREILNYGHTFAHALENLGNYGEILHGEAVALGMIFAAHLGEKLGITDKVVTSRTLDILAGLGLPTKVPSQHPANSYWMLMRRDKKARGGVRFVLCPRAGTAILVDQPEEQIIRYVLHTFAHAE